MIYFLLFFFFSFAVAISCVVLLFSVDFFYHKWEEKIDYYLKGKKKSDIFFCCSKEFFDGCKNMVVPLGIIFLWLPKNGGQMSDLVFWFFLIFSIAIFVVPFVIWGMKISIYFDSGKKVIPLLFATFSIVVVLFYTFLHPDLNIDKLPESVVYIREFISIIKEDVKKLFYYFGI